MRPRCVSKKLVSTVRVFVLMRNVEITLLDSDGIFPCVALIPFVTIELAVKKEETARDEVVTFCRNQSPL